MKRLEITVVSRAGAEFRGYRVRELYVELTGRSPVYNTLTQAWTTQTSRVPDLAALGELRGYLVVVRDIKSGESEDSTVRNLTPVTDVTPQTPAPVPTGEVEPGRGLW